MDVPGDLTLCLILTVPLAGRAVAVALGVWQGGVARTPGPHVIVAPVGGGLHGTAAEFTKQLFAVGVGVGVIIVQGPGVQITVLEELEPVGSMTSL